jgi:hypothetical protein
MPNALHFTISFKNADYSCEIAIPNVPLDKEIHYYLGLVACRVFFFFFFFFFKPLNGFLKGFHFIPKLMF